jgi:hypothetical protein
MEDVGTHQLPAIAIAMRELALLKQFVIQLRAQIYLFKVSKRAQASTQGKRRPGRPKGAKDKQPRKRRGRIESR